VKWDYTKDSSYKVGQDASWIDAVNIVSNANPWSVSSTGSQGGWHLDSGYTYVSKGPHSGNYVIAVGPTPDSATSTLSVPVNYASPAKVSFYLSGYVEPLNRDHLEFKIDGVTQETWTDDFQVGRRRHIT